MKDKNKELDGSIKYVEKEIALIKENLLNENRDKKFIDHVIKSTVDKKMLQMRLQGSICKWYE